MPDKTLVKECLSCNSKKLEYEDKDIVCQHCGAVWHYCVGDNCPYETEEIQN